MIDEKVNPERNPISKEKIDYSRDVVVKLSQLGCTDKEVASVVGMSTGSLKTHLREELDKGRTHLRRSLRKAQLELAINEKNPTMLIWLGKNYLGQREPKSQLEHSGGVTVEKVMFNRNGKEDKNSGSHSS